MIFHEKNERKYYWTKNNNEKNIPAIISWLEMHTSQEVRRGMAVYTDVYFSKCSIWQVQLEHMDQLKTNSLLVSSHGSS